MKRSTMARTFPVAAVMLAASLAGCQSTGDNMFASQDKTIEYYRVFDIRTNASPVAVNKAASEGINRNLKDAVVSTPAAPQVGEVPGRFTMSGAPGTGNAPVGEPGCEGASWTAKAAPAVRGGSNMNLVACLFPYRSGYHLDMYAVFTRPDGGLMAWPRRLGGAVLGTPEEFTERTMMDLVRAIREGTGANISLVEARPELAGAPWMGSGPGNTRSAGAPAGAPQPAAAPVAAAFQPTSQPAPLSLAAPAPPAYPAAAAPQPAAAPAAAPAPVAPPAATTATAPVAAPGTLPSAPASPGTTSATMPSELR